MRIEVYADGAAMNNGSAGSIGYAAVLLLPRKERAEFASGEACNPSSSVRAELLGIITGLTEAKERTRDEVLVFSDSEGVVKCIRGDYQANAHLELIQQARALLRLFKKSEVNWVRGHCGHELNERAHTLANREARKAWQEKQKEERCQGKAGSLLTRSRSRSKIQRSLFGNSSPSQPTLPNENASPPSSLIQAQLERAPVPAFVEAKAFLKWFNRFNGESEIYTTESLREREDEVWKEIAALKRLRARPPAEMTGEEWLRVDERLQKLEGQARAISMTLSQRSQKQRTTPTRTLSLLAGVTSKPGLNGFTSSKDPALVNGSEREDPFADQ